MKLYMFRTVRLPIIRSLFTELSTMVYVVQVCRQLSRKTSKSCSKSVYKPIIKKYVTMHGHMNVNKDKVFVHLLTYILT